VLVIIYKFVPGHKQKIINQIPGAVIATLGWFIISTIFSVYLNAFKGFSVMYGSLTTIALAMMWIYFCMYIILIGALINNFSARNMRKN
jgi:membrane protein